MSLVTTDEMPQAIRAKSNPQQLRGFVTAVWRGLPARRTSLLALGSSLVLTGAGHGALAFAAGMLTRSLAQPRAASGEGFGLLEACYFGLAAACVKAAGSTLLGYFQAKTAGNVAMARRQRFVTHWSARGLPDAAPRVVATVAVRLAELESAVVQGVLAALRSLAQLAPIVVGLIFVSPRLAAVGTLLLLPFSFVLAALRRRFRRQSELAQGRAVALHQAVDELVSHLDLWRTFGATTRVAHALESTGRVAVSLAARVEGARAALSGANEVLGALALLACVALAERAGATFGDGSLVAFAAVCFMAYRPLRDLGDARAWLERGAAAHEALERVMTEEPARQPAVGRARDWTKRRGVLELRELGARARGPRATVSLMAGQTLGLFGANGSGKTTLLRALLGLEPAAGALEYDGVELTHAGVGPEARPFAWVPQDAPLVTGTVLENVALACGDASRARLALAELGADRLLARAGERVGPGGTPLSGGERRLVALARALATDLPVLLLDEPTEGLDQQSRARVLAAIAGLGGARTVVWVTHDREVAALADRVLSLDLAPALAAE